MDGTGERHGVKIKWTAVGGLALAGLASAALALLGRSVIPDPFGPPRLGFVNPSTVTAGPDGLVVVSDSGDRRVIGMERDGSLRFVVAGRRRSGGFYNGRALGFDAAGRFYVDDAVLDRRTGNASTESLLAFDSRGRRLEPAYSREFTEEESSDVLMRLLYSQVSPGSLSWFFPDPDGTWSLHRLPLDGSPAPAPVRFEGYDVYDTVDAAFGPDGVCWLLERSGSVLRREGDGLLEQWYWDLDGMLRFPVAMAVGPAGNLFVLEGKTSVVRLDPGPAGASAAVVLDPGVAERAGYDRPLALANLSVSADGSLWAANEATGEALAYHPDGTLESWDGAVLTGRWALLRIALMAAWIASGSCLAAAAVLFYAKVFGMKARLLLKQLSILMPLTALAVGAIAWSVYLRMDRGVQAETESRLRHLAQLTAAGLSAEAVDSIDPSAGRLEEVLGSEGFRNTVSVLDSVVNLNQDSWNSNLFPYVYFRRGGEWYIAGGFDYLELYPYAYSKPEFLSVLDGGWEEYYRYSDVYGSWLSALTPLFREDGTVAAVVEASMGADFLDELGRATLGRIALSTAGLLILLLGVFTVFDAMLLRSVKALKDGADRVSEGDYEVPVDIRSRDEIEELGDAFNTMSERIKESLDELSRLGRANARFVPTEFLAQLGRVSITEIGLGDQKLTEMCVMFSDIRSFTQLSERMGPSATMDMLNDYLSRMGPAVREAGGFIDKYVGDAIMALFPRRPLDAVDACWP